MWVNEWPLQSIDPLSALPSSPICNSMVGAGFKTFLGSCHQLHALVRHGRPSQYLLSFSYTQMQQVRATRDLYRWKLSALRKRLKIKSTGSKRVSASSINGISLCGKVKVKVIAIISTRCWLFTTSVDCSSYSRYFRQRFQDFKIQIQIVNYVSQR